MRFFPLLLALVLASPVRGEEAPANLEGRAKPLLQKYCLDCHNEKKSEGELNLAAVASEEGSPKWRKVWTSVHARVTRHEMPPEDAPQPTAAEAELLQQWFAEVVKQIDLATPPQPGRVTMRRLNRVEYRNTIRDLFQIEFDLAWEPTRDFPADGAGYGFDNNGDVLSISPLHLEKYLAAASQVLERAVVVDGLDGAKKWSFAAKDLRIVSPSRPNGASGTWPTHWVAEIDVRQAGEYRVKAVIRAEDDNGKQAQLAIQTDGRQPEKFTLTRQGKTTTTERKVTVTEAGRKQFWVAYLHEQGKSKFEEDDADNGVLTVESLEISGPYIDLEKVPASHRRLFVAVPSEEKSREQAAEEILTAFLPRAFRRPVPQEEVAKYVAFFRKADQPGESFATALLTPLKAILVSPHFLYRVEVDQPAKAGAYALGPYELANRLSYFLWSSMPDDELFSLAADGSLINPDVLEAQVRRMLADPKALTLAENFTAQWLQIHGLDTFQPDPKVGKLSTRLRNAMQQEPMLIFHEVLTQNRSLTELIDADFTYANAELAKHYKMPLVPEHDDKSKEKDRDRVLRYELPDGSHRGGLLTTAAVLTATSHPDRTSPVKRGKWVLDALLGAPPPPPPPAVEALEDSPEVKGKLTLRQRLEAHRTQAACASCHKRMDPLGFAFEHYDGIGRWREKDGSLAIDSAAVLPEGKSLDGVPGLQAYLLTEKDAFARCLAEKMLTYALGRGVEPYDGRAVDAIVARVKQEDYRLESVVLGVVASEPFRRRSLADVATGVTP